MASENKVRIHDKDFFLFISQVEIAKKVNDMAIELNRRFEGKAVDIIIIMDGAEPFSKAILHLLDFKYQLHYVQLKTYKGMLSGESLEIGGISQEHFKQENVLILEDIIDTGYTLHQFIRMLKEDGYRQVFVASLLIKPKQLKYPVTADLYGFEIGPEFVVGFGMDYDEGGRELQDIYRLKD